MTVRLITWQPGTESLGSAVVAIGVFDGVHIGHQALLLETVADAEARGAQAVVVTFDRDPDQIVSPQTAAPQLLTLADKLAAIGRCGVDAILVVPFTTQLAEMAPETFLDDVLLAALTPLSVHVGSDFRFGRMAMGDVSTLRMTGATHGVDVVPHELVTVGGEAVTSTRIRGLIAAGKITDAVELLGGHPCVTGTVHRGRGEGAQLGFPTANVVPVEFAALPGAGVYAGRATIADDTSWAAAISVGTPPMFPDAKDYLEAHLVGFEGDLYDQPITLEFRERLRDQQTYPSIDELKTAIATDVERSLDIAGFTDEEVAEGPVVHCDTGDSITDDEAAASGQDDPTDGKSAATPDFWDEGRDCDGERIDGAAEADYIANPAALEAAEQAAMHAPSDSFAQVATGDWVPVIEDRYFTILGAGAEAFALAAPLEAANIPFCWDPYPPDDSPAGLRGAVTRPFTSLVPEDLAGAAAEALQAAENADSLDDDDAQIVSSTPDCVSDPVALEAAEQAVRAIDRHADDPEAPPPSGWVVIARDMLYDKPRLGAIAFALSAQGLNAQWRPFEPFEAPLLRLFALRDTKFTILTPAEEADTARALIAEVNERMAREAQGPE